MARKLYPTREPNVIPFIDVLLVLLIIFMVTAPKPTTDLHVELPRPSARTNPQPQRPTVVMLQEAPGGFRLFVDDEPATLDDLGARTLAHAMADNPAMPTEAIYAEARVFVRADQSTAYSNVVEVMNRLREAHFARVGIFAETAQEG